MATGELRLLMAGLLVLLSGCGVPGLGVSDDPDSESLPVIIRECPEPPSALPACPDLSEMGSPESLEALQRAYLEVHAAQQDCRAVVNVYESILE